ncbi:MAG: hypothetical protein SNJ57_01220 [Cyanobacteriota bacterium]
MEQIVKTLRLMRIRCNGLSVGETLQLRPVFRDAYLDNLITVTRNWQALNPQSPGRIPPDFVGRLYLYSPQDVPLFVSRNNVSYANTGVKIARFDPVNPSTARVGVEPRLRYVVEQVVPISAPAPIRFLLRPVFFLIDLAIGLSITLFNAAGSLIRLIFDPGNRLFVPTDDDEDDNEDDDTDQKLPKENIPQ